MAAQGHEANAPTAGEYIIHHLQHLQSGKQTGVVDFSVFNMDSVFWAVSLGILTCWLLWLAARKATSGVPGRFQAAVEILVEMVDAQAKGIVHSAETVSYTHLRAHETVLDLVCRLLLEKKKQRQLVDRHTQKAANHDDAET